MAFPRGWENMELWQWMSFPTSSRSAECNFTLRNLETGNSMPCGTDGIMGITQDSAHALIVHTYIAE